MQPTKHVCTVSMAGCQTKIINMKMYWIKSPAPLVRNAIKHSSYESHMCTFFGSSKILTQMKLRLYSERVLNYRLM